MSICHGRVKIKKIPKLSATEMMINASTTPTIFCKICYDYTKPENSVSCISPNCRFVGHLRCLAEIMLEPGQYVPIQGSCPSCKKNVLWGDLIRKKNGCSDLVNCSDFESEDDSELDEILWNDSEDAFIALATSVFFCTNFKIFDRHTSQYSCKTKYEIDADH